MMTTPAHLKISVRNLDKSFGKKVVLKGLDLDVARGESVVVIGGSGTGKSVTIKCILGLLTPDAGKIEIDGENVLEMESIAREKLNMQIGMLFQHAALFDSLPVWENVAFRLLQQDGMRRRQARDRAIEKLGLVGLAPGEADLFPSELSGGMQKRVGIARAMAADPDVLLLDEPTD